MGKIRLTKEFTLETGHALYGYDGKCRNIHGHSYKLAVTILGGPIKEKDHVKLGMVMDFGDLKKIVSEEIISRFDHATVFNKHTPHRELAEDLANRGHKVILADYQPTCENLVEDFAQRIKDRLPDDVELHSIRLRETETAFAEWFAADN